MKECSRCRTKKELSEYHKNKAQADGYSSYCKDCRKTYDKQWCLGNREKVLGWKKQANKNMTEESKANKNALNRMRNARLKKATAPWANLSEIKKIYKLAAERNLVVDHIVPLNNPLVCGLHVEDNLRCIPRELNAMKSNKFNQDYLSSFGIRGADKLLAIRGQK